MVAVGVCREVQKKRTAPVRMEIRLWRLSTTGHRAGAKHKPQAGAASQRWKTHASWPLPPCPSARTRQAWRRASPAGSVRQDAMSFLDEPSSSGNVPGCGRGDSCVPKIQPRSCLSEPTKQRQKQSWQGVHGPSQGRDRPLPGLHLPGPQPACKVRPIEVPPAGDDGPSHSSAPSARKH